MSKFILTSYNQNGITDQGYVRIQKGETVYIIHRNKVENLPKKTLNGFTHTELEYMAEGAFMITKGIRKFGHLGIFHKVKNEKKT